MSVYISKLELAVENKKIVRPYIPTIRYITPLLDENNNLKMLLVLNIYANSFLHKLHSFPIKQQSLLINQDGFYLHHPNQAKEWGSDLGHNASLKTDLPRLFKMTQKSKKGSLFFQGKIYTFKRIYASKKYPTRYWVLIFAEKEKVILSELREFKYIFIGILIVVFFMTIIIANRFTNAF
ncbi:MAG: methyl-accepting chemotaxis protein [bacterium]|jgi:methyl-accepting chemotaxis protein